MKVVMKEAEKSLLIYQWSESNNGNIQAILKKKAENDWNSNVAYRNEIMTNNINILINNESYSIFNMCLIINIGNINVWQYWKYW